MKLLLICLACSIGFLFPKKVIAQDMQPAAGSPDTALLRATFETLSKKGTSIYVNGESSEIKKLHKSAASEFSAWGYWNIVTDPEDAQYILEVVGMRTGLDVFSYATVRVQGIIHDRSGRVFWTSPMYKGESNGLTGFNPVGDALGKLIKRGIEPTFGINY